ncbi:MAG: hypothetical protein AAGK17_11605 [Pseudomonadota bacterium]
MTRHKDRSSSALKSTGIAICLALLAGCSVTTPPVLRSDIGVARDFAQIDLLEPEQEQVQRLELHNSVSVALQSHGIAVLDDPNSDTVGEVAIADSPGTVGLYAGEAGKSDENARPIAQIYDSRWYESCETSRMKASLAVFDRATGALIKRSEVESITCVGDALPTDQIAELLTRELISE